MASNIDFMQLHAIDMHAHLGTYTGFKPTQSHFVNADAEEVVKRARDCNIVKTVASDLGAAQACTSASGTSRES